MIKSLTATIVGLLLAGIASAESMSFKDNGQVAVGLSATDYNRLVIQHDKVLDAVFPEEAMQIKPDNQDGGVYVKLLTTAPFTLFLTTEAGRHLTVTVNSEEGLGKTFAFTPVNQPAARAARSTASLPVATNTANPDNTQILDLIEHLSAHKPVDGMQVSRPFNKVERPGKNLVITHKEIWKGIEVTGEILEVYNAGKTPLALEKDWFVSPDVQALKLSETSLKPHQTALLYRVRGVTHG